MHFSQVQHLMLRFCQSDRLTTSAARLYLNETVNRKRLSEFRECQQRKSPLQLSPTNRIETETVVSVMVIGFSVLF